MGLFDFPRIHVFGTQVMNVGTGNNDSASPGAELTVTSNTERVQAVTRGRTDADFRQWMMSTDENGYLRAQWNYFGDFTFRFLDVRVRSVQLGYDMLLTKPQEDPLIGAAVSLNHAVMIDTNPEGYHTTQVFAESLQISAPKALISGSFVSRTPTRATTRWLNWFRNVSFHSQFALTPTPGRPISSGGAGGASATFQCGIHVRRGDLDPVPHENSDADVALHRLLPEPQSPGMLALVDALRDDRAKGLLFRYNLYLSYPRMSDTELAAVFASGVTRQNPCYGLILGTISPWYKGEPSTITMGRFLKPARTYQNPKRDNAPYVLSPCVASVDAMNKRVSIDLANCLPEDGEHGEKFDMGPVTLGMRVAIPPGDDPSTYDSPVTSIGALRNDQATFLNTGGIWDAAYGLLGPDSQLNLETSPGHEIVLSAGTHGVLLYETEYMVESDCSCMYLDELPPGMSWTDPAVREELDEQPYAALRGKADIYLRRRGHVPAGVTDVLVEQWVTTPTGYIDPPSPTRNFRWPQKLSVTETLSIDQGKAEMILRPGPGSGMRTFRFVPPGLFPRQIDPEVFARQQFQEFFLDVRVLPYDDYDQIDRRHVTFELIYQEIFRYYYLILPAMSEYLDMADRTIWEAPTAAHYVMRMTSPHLWGHYNYMPRTRDLSRYRRDLLWKFCQNVIDRFEPPKP
jgi:hypothetical protein